MINNRKRVALFSYVETFDEVSNVVNKVLQIFVVLVV